MRQQHVAAATRCAAVATATAPATPYCPFGSPRRRLSHCAKSPAVPRPLRTTRSYRAAKARRLRAGQPAAVLLQGRDQDGCDRCRRPGLPLPPVRSGQGVGAKVESNGWPTSTPAACAGERSTTTPTNRASQFSIRGSSPRQSRRTTCPHGQALAKPGYFSTP